MYDPSQRRKELKSGNELIDFICYRNHNYRAPLTATRWNQIIADLKQPNGFTTNNNNNNGVAKIQSFDDLEAGSSERLHKKSGKNWISLCLVEALTLSYDESARVPTSERHHDYSDRRDKDSINKDGTYGGTPLGRTPLFGTPLLVTPLFGTPLFETPLFGTLLFWAPLGRPSLDRTPTRRSSMGVYFSSDPDTGTSASRLKQDSRKKRFVDDKRSQSANTSSRGDGVGRYHNHNNHNNNSYNSNNDNNNRDDDDEFWDRSGEELLTVASAVCDHDPVVGILLISRKKSRDTK